MSLKGGAEGAIAVEAALLGKHDGRCGWHRILILMVEADEMLDAQTVDIGIIGDALLGKVGTEVGAVGTDDDSKLLQGKVMLQVDLLILTVMLQQPSYINTLGGFLLLVVYGIKLLQRLYTPEQEANDEYRDQL